MLLGGTGITANANDIAIDSTVTTLTGTQTLTNKTINSSGNTLTLDLGEGTLTGTLAEFNTALQSASFTSLTGSETLTNKTLTSPVLNGTLSGTAFLDEDNMASNSAIAAASQQSIKAYVDATASGLDLKDSSHAATAAALAAVTYANGSSGVGATLTADANGALTVDGQTMVAGERVLVKDQAAGLQNGIYTVTATGSGGAAFVLTRTTDFDSPAEVTSGAFTFVETGTTNADSGWVMTTDGAVTIGTTALAFSQFSGAGQITAGAGMTKSGNTLNVIGTADKITVSADAVTIATTYVGQNTITTLGTVGTGTWQGTAVADGYLGTGINAIKLADGTVTNAELQYINTLSSNAQTQIDTKATKGFSIAMGVALG